MSALDRASKIIALPKGPSDIDVGTVFLWRSARVTASLTPPFGATKVTWTLGRAEEGAKTTEVVREGAWTTKRPQIVIDNLEPGHYLLTFHGDGPLQTYAVPVTVDAGSETAVPISITSTIVDLQVLSGDKPPPNAVVRFEHSVYLWKGTIDCDDQGKSTTELWQGGKFWILTQSKGIVVDGQLQTLAGDRERDSVEIHLPAHSLRGDVVDAGSGAAISEANISLEVAGKGVRNLVSDHDGVFEFEAVQEGRHVLRAYKKGYRTDRSTALTVSPQDTDLEHTIALTSEAAMREARLIDVSGHPVPGADAFFGAGAYVHVARSDRRSGHRHRTRRNGHAVRHSARRFLCYEDHHRRGTKPNRRGRATRARVNDNHVGNSRATSDPLHHVRSACGRDPDSAERHRPARRETAYAVQDRQRR